MDQIANILSWVAQNPPAGKSGGFPPQLIYPVVAIFVIFYLLILRPQRAEQRKRQQVLETMGKGDSVVTIGGMHGVIESIDAAKGIIAVTVAPKITVRFNKSAISVVESRKSKEDREDTPTA